MKIFEDLTTRPEEFEDFKKRQFDDDEKLKRYFDKCDHKQFLFSLIKLGVLLDDITTYFEFVSPLIQQIIDNEKDRKNDGKIMKIIRDLNKKINLDFGLDEDVSIVEQCVLFDRDLFIFFDKAQFIKEIELKRIQEE